MRTTGIRGSFFDFVDDPWKQAGNEEASCRYLADGLMAVESGRIVDFGEYDEVLPRHPGLEIIHLKDRLILPGFIDGHVHFPQTRILGGYGEHLLPWLQKWVFPEERKFKDVSYAKAAAREFFNNLLASGTTTCQAFTISSPVSTEAFFMEALSRDMRVIAGLTGMDRMAPEDCMDTAANFYRDSSHLIDRFHREGRCLYAITPRFAYGASEALLDACRRLKQEHPDCWVNTHISENLEECRGAMSQHPGLPDQLSIFEKHDLVGPKFTGGHGVHLSDEEFRRLSRHGAAVCFCPCSNLFLGSGLFPLGRAMDPAARVRVAIGSDVGGGNRFCLLNVLDEAYKVGMCNRVAIEEKHPSDAAEADRNRLSPYRAFWLATLGGAQALYIDDKVGNFDVGKEADFVVLDWSAGPAAQSWHQSLVLNDGRHPMTAEDAAGLLFGMMATGDDRNVDETWIAGRCAYRRSRPR